MIRLLWSYLVCISIYDKDRNKKIGKLCQDHIQFFLRSKWKQKPRFLPHSFTFGSCVSKESCSDTYSTTVQLLSLSLHMLPPNAMFYVPAINQHARADIYNFFLQHMFFALSMIRWMSFCI
jgi:hypothetical protein